MPSNDSSEPIAVVFTYLPDEDRCYHTPFRATEKHPDPLSFAHAFRKAEEERGDFPGSIWTVAGNVAAAKIRENALMRSLGFDR